MHRVSDISRLALIAVFTSCPLWTDEVCAQSTSLFGNRGPLAQSGTGSGIGANGQSALTGSGLGQSAAGRTTQPGALSANAGQGFIGRGSSAGRFVGNRLAGQQNSQQANTAQFGRLGGRRSQGNPFGKTSNSNRLGNRTGRARRVIRPRQRIAFSFPKLEPSSRIP